MFEKGKEKRRLAARAKQYRRGYLWAAGMLLLDKKSPLDVQKYECIVDHTPFDDGARDCTNRLVSDESILDNRVY